MTSSLPSTTSRRSSLSVSELPVDGYHVDATADTYGDLSPTATDENVQGLLSTAGCCLTDPQRERLVRVVEENRVLEAKYREAIDELEQLKAQTMKMESRLESSCPCSRAGEVTPKELFGNGHDQLLVLSINGRLYHVSGRLLRGETHHFEGLLQSEQARHGCIAGLAGGAPLLIEGVSCFEMESFLTFLYRASGHEEDGITLSALVAALKLATMWSCTFMRTKIITNVRFDALVGEAGPFYRLEVALDCNIRDWVYPAYDAICRRPESLTVEEGKSLGWERFAEICRLREMIAKASCANYTYLHSLSTTAPSLIPDPYSTPVASSELEFDATSSSGDTQQVLSDAQSIVQVSDDSVASVAAAPPSHQPETEQGTPTPTQVANSGSPLQTSPTASASSTASSSPSTPAATRPFFPMTCPLCKVPCGGDSFRTHMSGRKHKSNAAAYPGFWAGLLEGTPGLMAAIRATKGAC